MDATMSSGWDVRRVAIRRGGSRAPRDGDRGLRQCGRRLVGASPSSPSAPTSRSSPGSASRKRSSAGRCRAGPCPSTTRSTASGGRSPLASSPLPGSLAARAARRGARLGRSTSSSTGQSATGCAHAMASSAPDDLTPRAREIVAAARLILEQSGPDALSMRAIAEELGIRAPSLYKHVADKETLEVALIADALAETAVVFESRNRRQRRPTGRDRCRLPGLGARPPAPVPADDGPPAATRAPPGRPRGPRCGDPRRGDRGRPRRSPGRVRVRPRDGRARAQRPLPAWRRPRRRLETRRRRVPPEERPIKRREDRPPPRP